MEKIIYLLYVIMILSDILIICDARRLLLDFLIGQSNRKNAQKIHDEQSLSNKIKMCYIGPLLKKHTSAFQKYHTLYLIILYSLIPQYITVILLHIFADAIIWYVLGGLLIIKLLLAVFCRLELGSNRMSVYSRKKK